MVYLLNLSLSSKVEQIKMANVQFRRSIMSKKTDLAISFVLTSVLCLTLCTIAQAKDKPVTLDTDPGLSGWWKLDETSGKPLQTLRRTPEKARSRKVCHSRKIRSQAG